MRQVNVAEAKAQLSALIDAAVAGEEVVVAKAGVPAIRLVPVLATHRRGTFGKFRDRLREGPGAWSPLDAGDLAEWEAPWEPDRAPAAR